MQPPPQTPVPTLVISDLDSLSNSFTTELRIEILGFVLKKLLTYFQMLIVTHALHCVDGLFLAFILF